MTIRTFSAEIDDTAYVKVGSNVIIFEVVERVVGDVRIVVRDVGDPGPNINTDQFRPLDGTYTRDAGVERVLEAGATYLFRLINEDTSNTSAITSTATWYQGPLSVDL